MASLNFPTNPVNGQIYPSTPIKGQKVYQWDSTYQTWLLVGTVTGVAPDTYGDALNVARFTVDWAGKITFAEDVPIQLGTTGQVGLVQLTDNTTSDDPTTALTAAQGFYLQTQIGDLALLAPPSVDLVAAINTAYDKTADLILLNPAINGNLTVQSALEDTVYDIASAGNTVTISSTPTGLFNIEVTQATETQLGGTEIATQAEVDAGTDDTRAITPLKLAGYVSGGNIDSREIPLAPAINGNLTVQSALEDTVYDVASSNLTVTVTESAVGQVDITLPPVGAIGSYSYASVTVDQEGRVTAASTNTAPNTTVVSPITNTGTNVEPVIGVLPSSTTQSGVVQLNNTLTSGATDQALTAAMGQNLQQQLSALSVSGGLTNAGTFDASTGQMTNVSVAGATAGFTVGADVLSPSTSLLDYFVQITVAGTYSPPGGGGPFNMVQGDWLFCNGTNWIQVEIGPRLPDATTTVKGAVELSTDAETQAGTDATLAVTPASLSSRTATETRTGLAEIATQAEVNAGADDATIVTPLKLSNYIAGGGGGAPASGVVVSPAINGNADVQSALEDALYSVTSSTLTVTEAATGNVTIEAPAQLYHYAQLDDISSGFNDSDTAFPLTIGTVAYTPSPSGNLMVFLGGIAQIPGAGNAYTVSGSTITFTEPPLTGTSFYATTVTN